MSEKKLKALMSATASSAMEGLPLDEEMILAVKKILQGEMTFQDYVESIKLEYQGS